MAELELGREQPATTVVDVVIKEAIDREEAYEQASAAVLQAIGEVGMMRSAQLEDYVAQQLPDIGETLIMLAVSDALNDPERQKANKSPERVTETDATSIGGRTSLLN